MGRYISWKPDYLIFLEKIGFINLLKNCLIYLANDILPKNKS